MPQQDTKFPDPGHPATPSERIARRGVRSLLRSRLLPAAVLCCIIATQAAAGDSMRIEFGQIDSVTVRSRRDSLNGNFIVNEQGSGTYGTVIASSGESAPVSGTTFDTFNLRYTGGAEKGFLDTLAACRSEAILASRSPDIWKLTVQVDLDAASQVVHNEASQWLTVDLGSSGHVRCILSRR